jgi:hypothetical protein
MGHAHIACHVGVVASLWQQAGRHGNGRLSGAVCVCVWGGGVHICVGCMV